MGKILNRLGEKEMITRPGDIGFLHNRKSWVGRAIAWFMRSQWSHSFLILGDSNGQTLILETSTFEVTIGTLERYLANADCHVEIYRLTNEPAIEAETGTLIALADLYGEMYGYLQLISFAIQGIAARFGIKTPNFIRQGIVCTGVVLYAKAKGTIAPFAGIDPESLQTEQLFQLVQANADLIIKKPLG